MKTEEEIEKEFKRVDETYTWNYKNFVIFVMPIINKAIEKALLNYNQEVIKMIEEMDLEDYIEEVGLGTFRFNRRKLIQKLKGDKK